MDREVLDDRAADGEPHAEAVPAVVRPRDEAVARAEREAQEEAFVLEAARHRARPGIPVARLDLRLRRAAEAAVLRRRGRRGRWTWRRARWRAGWRGARR